MRWRWAVADCCRDMYALVDVVRAPHWKLVNYT